MVGRRSGRLAYALLLTLLVAACTGERVVAPPEEVARAFYSADGPPTITLFTMISNETEAGAHSGLMVSASQRVIFDPAGSFRHPQMPEVNDVFFWVTDPAIDFYIDYHARETFRVVRTDVVVTPEQAEVALQRVQEAGPVGHALCNVSITQVLRGVPGFEAFPQSWFPKRTLADFQALPGATSQVFRDDSPGDRSDLIKVPNLR